MTREDRTPKTERIPGEKAEGMIDAQLELVRHWVPKTRYKPTLFVDEDNDLAEADVVRGRTPTSYPTSQTDIRNAGGERMATNLDVVTGRRPDDSPALCAEIVEELAKGEHADRVVSGRLAGRDLPGRSHR